MALVVSALEWDLTNMRDASRMRHLLNGPSSDQLVEAILDEAKRSATDGLIIPKWEPAKEKSGFFRTTAIIPVSLGSFDALFNGPNGYRAHYYTSADRGKVFNDALVRLLIPILRLAHEVSGSMISWSDIHESLAGPWSKIWVANDHNEFASAATGELRPAKWCQNQSLENMSLRAPLPSYPAIDLKGTWLRTSTRETWLSPDKADRDQRLSDCGFV